MIKIREMLTKLTIDRYSYRDRDSYRKNKIKIINTNVEIVIDKQITNV
jgi:hypothetical protein